MSTPLPWLHFPADGDAELAQTLCEALLDRRPDASVIISGLKVPGLAKDDLVTLLPEFPGPNATRDPLELTARPTSLAWMAPRENPALFAHAHRLGIPVHMVDCGHMLEAHRGWRLLSRMVNKPFRHVSTIFVGDGPTRMAMLRSGARAAQLRQLGILERDALTLPCNAGELDQMARILSTRPVWLAAKIHFDELEAVLAAHQQALRRAHRLVLLLVPGDPDDGDAFAEQLRLKGLIFRQRSREEEPDQACQVYLADAPGELGLWYRLAPISFIGQTLAGRFGNGPDPLGAAALGSAVVHGPMIEHHVTSFSRLARARASFSVAHTGELAYALESFLAPDRAARMAKAAWEVSTSGAEVMNQLVELLLGESAPGKASAG